MKNKFILGFITGGIICATATGFAVEYVVTANPFPVAVNGTIIHISNYVTLPTLSAVSMLVSVTTLLRLIQIPPQNQHQHRLQSRQPLPTYRRYPKWQSK